MKKELNTFSLDFAVELPDYPKRNTFPGRKGKSALCRYDGGCYSFEAQGQLEDCHYYAYDYQ